MEITQRMYNYSIMSCHAPFRSYDLDLLQI